VKHWGEPGAQSPAKQSTKDMTMKKMLLLVTLLGLAAALSAKGAEAKENWETQCAKCHGADGKSDTKIGAKLGAKDFTDAKVQASFKDEEAIKAIKEGRKDKDDKTLMKAFDQLSDDEVKALVAYVRGFKK
jgi:mono/diheme cytochrome c family protein